MQQENERLEASASLLAYLPEAVLNMRKEGSAPIMAAFTDWVEKLLPGIPPTSAPSR